MKLTLLGMIAILGFVALLAMITGHLWENLVAGNMIGNEHDSQFRMRTLC